MADTDTRDRAVAADNRKSEPERSTLAPSERPSPSEAEFHALILNQVSDAVITIDNAGVVTYLNHAAERQYGIVAADAVGRPLRELYEFEWIDLADETAATEALVRSGQWRGENRHVLRDGRTLRVESSVCVLRSSSGAPAGLLAVIRDITATREAEEALRDRGERIRRALAIETVGVLFFTLGGAITDANPALERLSGYTREELRSMRDWIALAPPEFHDVTRRALADLRRDGETSPYEKQMMRKDGTRWWGLFAPRRIAGSGIASQCVEFIIDITERKQAEETVRRSEAQQSFLLRLNDTLRRLSDPTEIQFEAACALGRHLQVSRVGYAEDTGDGETIVVTRNYTDGVPGIEGRYRYTDYGRTLLEESRAGRTVVRSDIAHDSAFTDAEKTANAALQLAATVNIPLLRAGRLAAVFFIHHREPHDWSAEEIALGEAVAERTCEAVERARVEAALRISETRYSTLFQSIDEGFCIVQMIFDEADRPIDYSFLEINNVFERQAGLKDVLGRRVRELVPDLEPVWVETYGRIALTGEPTRFVQEAKSIGRWFDVYAFRIGHPEQRHVAMLFKDITESRNAADALEEANERQRIALEAAEMGTWTYEVTSGRVELDPKARLHYGVNNDIVALDEILTRIHPQDVSAVRAAIAAALNPAIRAPVNTEYRVLHASGAVRWLSVRGLVRFSREDGGERATVGIGTTRDVTEQKRADETLQAADRQKDEFLAILAHELRNPLAPIRTAVAILRAPGVPARMVDRSRDVIDRQVTHMARLIDDLLDVSRLSRGKMNLQRGPLLLDQVLDAAVETARPVIAQHQQRFAQRRVAGPVCLDGDLARLSQVFANLLNNAAKYTPAGGTITLDVAERTGEVAVSVTDTGQGIAPEHLERIFDLFAQGAGGSSVVVGGLGIGLALARRLVELHGGTLVASSQGLGRGATFTVTLPTVAIAEDSCGSADDASPAGHKLARRVLVVDDSTDAAETNAMLLQQAGCEVRAVYSGEQALEAMGTFRPEIVLLDIGMPGLNGLETCRRMRAMPHGSSLFIVALTGWGQDENRRQTRDAGFDAHLVKPVAPAALFDLIQQVR